MAALTSQALPPTLNEPTEETGRSKKEKKDDEFTVATVRRGTNKETQ